MLETIVKAAALIVYQSYCTISLSDALSMAAGQYEVDNDVDVDITLTEEIGNIIEAKFFALSNK